MSTKTPIVILASGRGSNFDAIVDAIDRGELAAQIVGVVSDREEAPVLEKARKKGLRAEAVSLRGLTRTQQDEKLLSTFARWPEQPRWVVLAGYMRILGAVFLAGFKNKEEGYFRVVNIHPALLPAFPGLHSYRQAFQYGAAVTGVTVHLVDEKMDHGPVCAQSAFSIEHCKTTEEVEQLGLVHEHQLYSKTLSWLLTESFDLIRKTEGRPCARSR